MCCRCPSQQQYPKALLQHVGQMRCPNSLLLNATNAVKHSLQKTIRSQRDWQEHQPNDLRTYRVITQYGITNKDTKLQGHL